MKIYLLFAGSLMLVALSCKQKPKEEEKKYISVVSLIEQQVKHIDTSIYSIRKVVSTDSLHHDTTYIKREDFRAEAKEFLDIPDLSDPKVAREYNEETMYDKLINRVTITYTPVNPDKGEVKQQQLQVTPNIATGDQVNNIMINKVINNREGFIKKNMLWRMDKSFQVITTSQLPGQPETIITTKVTWNEDNDQ